MKTRLLLFLFFFVIQKTISQQVIVYVFDPKAAVMRGGIIPSMLVSSAGKKIFLATATIPMIIYEEEMLLNKWRKTIIGNINSLSVLQVACMVKINSVGGLILRIPLMKYVPGFRASKRKFDHLSRRVKKLNAQMAALLGLSTVTIDGIGYVKVATQRLANDYIKVYGELRDVNFKIEALLAFCSLII